MIRYLIAALVACLFLIYGGWQRIQAQSVALDAATERNTQLEAAAASRRNTQRLLAQLDTDHTQERERANQTNSGIRAAVAAGERRLSVPARCPSVRTAAGATGLDAAEARAELNPAAAERIVRIANDGDDAVRALAGLQDYVNTVCLKRK
ncbi:lysis system i-spanin subunit Rz [Pseudomonas sp. 910_21]|uniref:lysis system i-spanin subunit Rz n=1 Tax=Pseudomonas sp. 910_21 TaxID=2604460 RepID=UPI004064A101